MEEIKRQGLEIHSDTWENKSKAFTLFSLLSIIIIMIVFAIINKTDVFHPYKKQGINMKTFALADINDKHNLYCYTGHKKYYMSRVSSDIIRIKTYRNKQVLQESCDLLNDNYYKYHQKSNNNNNWVYREKRKDIPLLQVVEIELEITAIRTIIEVKNNE